MPTLLYISGVSLWIIDERGGLTPPRPLDGGTLEQEPFGTISLLRRQKKREARERLLPETITLGDFDLDISLHSAGPLVARAQSTMVQNRLLLEHLYIDFPMNLKASD